jgi:hypothetical protein
MQQQLRFLFVLLLFGCACIPAYVSAAPANMPGSGFIVVASAPAADFLHNLKHWHCSIPGQLL